MALCASEAIVVGSVILVVALMRSRANAFVRLCADAVGRPCAGALLRPVPVGKCWAVR